LGAAKFFIVHKCLEINTIAEYPGIAYKVGKTCYLLNVYQPHMSLASVAPRNESLQALLVCRVRAPGL